MWDAGVVVCTNANEFSRTCVPNPFNQKNDPKPSKETHNLSMDVPHTQPAMSEHTSYVHYTADYISIQFTKNYGPTYAPWNQTTRTLCVCVSYRRRWRRRRQRILWNGSSSAMAVRYSLDINYTLKMKHFHVVEFHFDRTRLRWMRRMETREKKNRRKGGTRRANEENVCST